MSQLKNTLMFALFCLPLSSHCAEMPPEPAVHLRLQPRAQEGSPAFDPNTTTATEKLKRMNQRSLDRIHAQRNRVNALEMAAREDYFAYLIKKGDQTDSHDQFMEKYASLARFGTAATAVDIEELQTLSASTLPPPLIHFYRTLGSFDGGDHLHGLVVHSPEALSKCAAPDAEDWSRIRSIGMVDMIVLSWAGDRPEFDPNTGDGLTTTEVDTLNSRYSVVGWFVVEEGEGFSYLYFDANGKFGTLFYHQDAFDELYAEHLKPMLQRSSADQDFDEALPAFVEAAARPDALDESDE